MSAVAVDSRRRHASGAAHLAAALIVLLVVLLIALRSQPLTPPPIAAFAPQVNQVIQQAPSNQDGTTGSGGTSGHGNGPGKGSGGGPGGPSPTPEPSKYHCDGDRQIPDPQSPPCVTGGPQDATTNGGSTAPGVTGDAIEIAYPNQDGNNYSSDIEANAARAYAAFFNKYFDFYGRKIHITPYAEISNSVADQQTLASHVAGKPGGTFASAQFTDEGGWSYDTALASKKVIAVTGFEENPTEAQLQNYAPYLWSYEMASDNMMAEWGNWYCTELAGKNAVHAGPQYQGTQRRLGITIGPWDYNSFTPDSIQPLLDRLNACGMADVSGGGQPGPKGGYYVIHDNTENWGNADITFHTNGITSVFCVCNFEYWSDMANYASGQGYVPEWLLSSYGGNDDNWAFHFGNPNAAEASHALGLTFNPRQELLQNDPFWWAWSEGGGGTQPPQTIIDVYQVHLMYRSLLEIAAGIQMAGPNLTAETFAEGLQKTRFPNPITPLNAGFVDFYNGSHAMTVDAAEWWYSPSAPSPYASFGDASGAICYVNHGARHSLNDWKPETADPFFGPTCDSGA